MTILAPTALFPVFTDSVDRTVYTIAASFTPTANRAITLYVASGHATAGSNVKPTIGGTLGSTLTWTEEATVVNEANNERGTLWSANTGSSPATGTITATFSTAQSWCHAIGAYWEGADLADPIVQSLTGATTNPDNPSLTLAALQADAATYGLATWNNTAMMAAGTGMTAGQTSGSSTSPTGISGSEYDVSSPSTAVGWTTTLNLQKLYIAAEIRNAPTNTVPIADAGPDQIDKEPGDTIALNGGGSDSDGTIVSYSWNHISGPATNAMLSSTTAEDPTYECPASLAAATDVWRLTVTDNGGATDTDDVSITAFAATERAVSGGVEVPAFFRAN